MYEQNCEKILKSVQNWKSYIEYPHAPFFMGHGVDIDIDLIPIAKSEE